MDMIEAYDGRRITIGAARPSGEIELVIEGVLEKSNSIISRESAEKMFNALADRLGYEIEKQ
jgi:hypothetical protein